MKQDSLEGRILWLLLKSDTTIAEVETGVVTSAYGLWLISPNWDTLHTTKIFGVLASINSNDMFWGTLFLAAGLLRMTAVVMNFKDGRILSSIMAFMIWGTLFVSSVFSNPASTATALFGSLAAFSILVWLRLVAVRNLLK